MRYLPYRPTRTLMPTVARSSQCPLDKILCFKHRRKVSRDNTVKHKGCTLQLLPHETRQTYAGVHVEIQEELDGQLQMRYQGQTILSQ